MTIEALLPFFRLTLALHVISMVLWMAGMLTLPWLFVEHAGVAAGSPDGLRLAGLEQRLMRRTINPAMIATWLFGILLVLTPGAISWSAGWWWTKLTAVVLMSAFHGELSRWRRQLRDGRNARTAGFYRRVAGIPVALLVVIVFMVVTQPF